jgi:hypothetical protein
MLHFCGPFCFRDIKRKDAFLVLRTQKFSIGIVRQSNLAFKVFFPKFMKLEIPLFFRPRLFVNYANVNHIVLYAYLQVFLIDPSYGHLHFKKSTLFNNIYWWNQAMVLLQEVNKEKIEATYADGILKISLPRNASAVKLAAKHIAVK